jgi:multidrug efflux pump subunit AcrB
MWPAQLYRNHVLATLVYFSVVLLGFLAYSQLPREQAPELDLKVASIIVTLPDASAEDVEKRVIDPVEKMLREKIKDIDHVNTNASPGSAIVDIRFKENIKPYLYERHIQELRREIQVLALANWPKAPPPEVMEGNSFSEDWYKVLVYGPGNDDNFRRQARQVQRDLQQLPGIANVLNKGLEDAELAIVFDPVKLATFGLDPSALTNTIQGYFADANAGKVKVDNLEWLVRITGKDNPASKLANLPIVSAKGLVRLGDVAEITRSGQSALMGARFKGQPCIVLMPFKQPGANVLELVDRINAYIYERNKVNASTGVKLYLLIDTSDTIRNSLKVMEEHAWSGMLLVFAVTWLMLGTRLSLLTTLAVPFSLAGVFIALQITSNSLNLSVLLGIVIVLGMLVDDAVVVVEAIDDKLRRGLSSLDATVAALKEVWLPVTTSSFTTIASFIPLILVGGFLGQMMGIVPQVVCIGLMVSLVQALWIVPTQAVLMVQAGPLPDWRYCLRLKLQRRYTSVLIRIFRAPKKTLSALAGVFIIAGSAWIFDWIKADYLLQPPNYGFIITLEMPTGTNKEKTLAKLEEIEKLITPLFRPGELRASAIESGSATINGKPFNGHQYGDIWFSMVSNKERTATQLLPDVRQALSRLTGMAGVWVEGESTALTALGKPINLRLSAMSGSELDTAIAELKAILASIPGVFNIKLDNTTGMSELNIRLNGEAIQRAGVNPSSVTQYLQLLTGGEAVTTFNEEGETVTVKVIAKRSNSHDIQSLLEHTIMNPAGGTIPLSQLVTADKRTGPAGISHVDYKRILTLQADLNKNQQDTLSVNQQIRERWDKIKDRYPDVHVELSGEMLAIQEGLSHLWQQFVLGIGLIFIIVGAQFKSYIMPFLVLMKVPMAFSGLILGLLISREPVSLYTLYGAVALTGIAVNSAILMFSAGHDRLRAGTGVVHASLYAAKRRLLPILITSFTTMTGLLPLALSNEQSSTQWRPVATAIAWGVGFSTILTLFIVPLLFRLALGLLRSDK